MTKDKYLEDLYQELQKYDIDSIVKHVTEYDYIISDMIEDDHTEDFNEKLGTPQELAESIAEEFGYELKNVNQYSEPIIGGHKDYGSQSQSNKVLITIINCLFIFFAIIYILTVGGTLIGFGSLALFTFAFSLGGGVLGLLAVLSATAFSVGLFMIFLNLKRLLTNGLMTDRNREVM